MTTTSTPRRKAGKYTAAELLPGDQIPWHFGPGGRITVGSVLLTRGGKSAIITWATPDRTGGRSLQALATEKFYVYSSRRPRTAQ